MSNFSVNTLLSKKMEVEPLREGEVAEFRLINAGSMFSNVKDEEGNVKPLMPAYSLTGKCNVRDFGDSKNPVKTIMNITGYDPKPSKGGGPTVMDPIVQSVKFERGGILLVTANQLETYYFLKRHNGNRDNPFRNPTKEVVFYEVNEEQDRIRDENNWEYQLDAMNHLDSIERDELLKICFNINELNDSRFSFDLNNANVGDLKRDLQAVARDFPQIFLQASDNNQAKLKMMIEEANRMRLIFFNDHPEQRNWKFKKAVGEKGKELIVQVEVGNDPVQALIDHLDNDQKGREHCVELKQRLEDYYSVLH